MSNDANTSKDQKNGKQSKDDQPKKLEKKDVAIKRLTGEVLHEAKLIAGGLTESCYTLVEKTKKLMELEGDDKSDDDKSGDDQE